jgi:RHH-type rel operon transcriptional repressor/antitoxin RelB
MLALRLPVELEERLSDLARRTGRTKSFYARQAIIEYIDDMEEHLWAEKIIAEWEASDKHTIPAEELWAELGI